MKPLISIIVPVYNVEKYLPGCLDSILDQTCENLEILLVDDGTRDSCDKICDKYAEKDPRIRVFHKENGGQSSARNLGLDEARGEYIAFVDSDDRIQPDACEQLLDLALKYNVKLVCGGRYNVDEKSGRRTPGLCPPREEKITAQEMLRRIFLWEDCDSAPWDKLYHRSLFDVIRFPSESGSEDVGILYRLVDLAGDAAMLPKPVYNYLQRSGSTSSAALNPKNFNFEKQTKPLYDFIREQYPAIEPEARYLRVRSLVYSVLSVELAEKSARIPFRQQARKSRKSLRSHTFFILRSPLFQKKERITDLALAWGLYPLLRKLYHAVT